MPHPDVDGISCRFGVWWCRDDKLQCRDAPCATWPSRRITGGVRPPGRKCGCRLHIKTLSLPNDATSTSCVLILHPRMMHMGEHSRSKTRILLNHIPRRSTPGLKRFINVAGVRENGLLELVRRIIWLHGSSNLYLAPDIHNFKGNPTTASPLLKTR